MLRVWLRSLKKQWQSIVREAIEEEALKREALKKENSQSVEIAEESCDCDAGKLIFTCEYNSDSNRVEVYCNFDGAHQFLTMLRSIIANNGYCCWIVCLPEHDTGMNLSIDKQSTDKTQLCDQFCIYCWSRKEIEQPYNSNDPSLFTEFDLSVTRLLDAGGEMSEFDDETIPFTRVTINARSNLYIPLYNSLKHYFIHNNDYLGQRNILAYSLESTVAFSYKLTSYDAYATDGIDFYYVPTNVCKSCYEETIEVSEILTDT